MRTNDARHDHEMAIATTSLRRDAKPDMKIYTIGDLAREFNVTLRALRFYEDKGLLDPARDGLTRLYSARDRERLTMILKGKRLGFTLVEIGDMIATHEDGAAQLALNSNTVRDQIAHLERQRSGIDEALMELRRSYEQLSLQTSGKFE